MNNLIRRAIRAHHREQHERAVSRSRFANFPSAFLPLAAVSLATLAAIPSVLAQQSSEASVVRLEEVIVSARRKDEMLQDVPLTVNVVDESAIADLNVRQLSDIQGLVAGLTLATDPIAPNASMRGVRFDTFASGFNSTVEFYLNDSPIVSSLAMQALFDVAQIEVLRGPQGTLRGRASPSGAINITTQQANLESFGGYIDLTRTNHHGYNTRAAVNVPILRNMLGLRIAGFQEENEGTRVRSTVTGERTEVQSEGFRGTLLFTPLDVLSFNLMYQRVTPKRWQYTQMESAFLKDSSLAPTAQTITAEDRLTGSNIFNYSDAVQERTGLEIAWDLADNVVLNYAGSLSEQVLDRKDVDDWADIFDASYPQPALQNLGQVLHGEPDAEAHELRLTVEFDRFDFVFGALHQTTKSVNSVEQQTPVFIGFLSPGSFATVARTPVVSDGASQEKSLFGNVTYHVTDDTELSVGLRTINFTNDSSVVVSGRTISDSEDEWNKAVYMVSLKHTFTPDLMAYATLGSSWRPGINTVGNFNTQRSAREQSFVELEPETSESLEVGFKSSHFDNRLRFNGAAYYQKFDNYPYRSGGTGVFYASTNAQGVESVEQFNFVAAVPVDVYGFETELSYQILPNWNAGMLYSWSRGALDDGTVPCNDYGGQIPTVTDIRNATGGDNVASCQAKFRSNFAPLWTTTLQSEYSLPLDIGAEAYVRGLVTFYGKSQNDPTNDVDDVGSYNIVNLYTGLRSDEGTWEVMLYGKNLFETERVLSRGATPDSLGYQAFVGFGPSGPITQGRSAVSGYREITMTEPREFGVNVRYNF